MILFISLILIFFSKFVESRLYPYMKIYLRSILFIISLLASHTFVAQKLYWVGGSGNFNDPAHWSYESNGLGGTKTPTSADDVYFDENSFRDKSVISIIGGANCHNLNFSEYTQPVIISGTPNEKITINGNAKFNPYVDNQFLGNVWFNSSLANTTVMFSFIKFKGDVYFEGNTNWIIQSNINTVGKGSVYLNKGVFDFSNTGIYAVNCIASPQVILNTKNAVFDIKSKFILPAGLTLNDTKSYVFADITNPLNYQVSPSVKFNTASRINGNQNVYACAIGTPTVVAPTCSGACNGSISFTIPAGCSVSGPLCATWSVLGCTKPIDSCGILPGSTYIVKNVCGCAQNYSVLFSDTSGNPIQSPTQVGVIAPSSSGVFNFPAAGKIQPSCNGLCNGSLFANLSVGTAPLTLVWATSITSTTHTNVISSRDTLKNACAGNYSVTITDANGCITGPFTTTLGQPTPLVTNGTIKAPLCFGSCNGVATVAPSGGTSPYTVVWDGVAASNTNTLTTLCAGITHTCVVTDKNGCTASYIATVPSAPSAITYTTNPASGILNIKCQNQCNGSLGVSNVSGGTIPYTFSWTPTGASIISGTNSTTDGNLCAGNYTCTITDKNGCPALSSFTITSPPALSHTLTVINPLCNGQKTGSIKDTISGGTPAYVTPFTWSPAGTVTGTASSSTNSNIGVGSYSVIVTDKNGCKDTAFATLVDPPAITATVVPTNPTCFSYTNGAICVNASGGTGAVYSYTWNPSEPHTNCISNLAGGNYTVTVADINNCKTVKTVTLTAPPQLNIAVSQVNPTCSGLCNGTATVTASGGTGGPYTYGWTGPSGALPSTTTQINLCAGTYTVVLSDGSCTQTKIITLINPNPLSVSISATSLVCASQCNAQITSNITGGTPTYTYSWSGTGLNPVSQGVSNQSNMCAGSYSLLVTDSNHCQAAASVVVAAPNAITITTTSVNPSCSSGCDGSISATILGGASPYAYAWSPSIIPKTLTPNNLCAGSYTLSVIDNNGCIASQAVTLTSPTSITNSVSITNVTCAGTCNGSATVTATGGTGPYLYSWDGASYTTSIDTTGFCAGKHTLQVKDKNGCTGTVLIFSITQPTALTAAVNNVTKSCLNICNGTATASASGGTLPYSYSWDNIAGTYTTSTTISTLCIGTHTLYAKDANGCVASTIFNVQVIINVSILANSISVSCHGVCDGSASATAVGGTPAYTYTWTNSSGTVVSNNQNAINLCPGTYTVLVEDKTTCASQDTITILNPTVLTASVSIASTSCFGVCNGSATITPSGGTPPYTEQWSNNGIIGTHPTGLCAGTYTATVKDNRGCTVIDPITITTPAQFVLTPIVSSPTACLSSTGSINLGIAGGSPTYTVNWSNPPGGTTTNLTGLASGIYTATVTDSHGCDTAIAIGVSDPTGPTTTTVVNQNASCFGSCDGSATVSGTGVNPINVIWTSGTPSGLSPVTNSALCANNYPVKVTDGNGCISIANVTITQPTQIKDGAIISPLTCSSGNTGSVTLNPSGGSGSGYSFNLDGVGPISNPVLGLSAGTHTVIITDGTNCSSTYTYNISAPTALVINVKTTNELCTNGCNGTAQAFVSGGNPPYTYAWLKAATNTISVNPNVASLCPGTYTLNVTDANKCSGQAIVTINAANAIVPNFVKQDNSCNSGCTGSATVTPTGGSGGSFTYNWNTPGSPVTTTVSALCPGSYFVIVTDTNHCTDTTHFSINAPATVSVSVAAISPTCFGYANGTATVTPSGGTPTYTVTWNPNICVGCTTTGSLTAGSYVATVTDSKGCTGSSSFTLKDSAQINANAVPTNPLCNNNCNGTIISSPTGGSGTYTYQWLGITPSPGNSATAHNLCPGTYTVIVSDSKNCQDAVGVTLTNPSSLQLLYSSVPAKCAQSNGAITISNVTPSGTLTVNWLAPSACGNNTSCTNLSAGVYSLTLTNANNCKDTFQIAITNSNGPLLTAASTGVTCYNTCNGTASVTNVTGNNGPPFTYSWSPTPGSVTNTATSSVASGLCNTSPGPSYISTIADTLGCKTLTTFSITSPPQIIDNPNIVNATCAGINNGSITSHGSGGTPSVLTGYSYQIDGLGFSGNNLFNTLAVGTHTVDIKDSVGCTNSFVYTINGNTSILSQIASTNIKCFGVCNGTATLSNVNGGTAPYLIAWSDPNGQTGPLAVNLCAGNYTATVTDNMGCQASQLATITAPSASVSAVVTVTNPACGLCNGSISLSSPSGGTGPSYTYTWSTSSTSSSITNVCAALYQVDISDAVGCITSYQVPVSNSNAPTATVSTTGVSCFGKCDGTASVVASGGTTPYTYNWVSPSATTSSVSSLCAGNYVVQVKDAANCIQTQSVTIASPTQIALNQTVTPTDCGKCSGAISLAPSGGSGSYSYTWNGPSGALASNPSQTNLCAGSYTVLVNDGTCTNTTLLAVNSSNAPIISVAVTNPTCFGQSNGSALVTIIGGVAPTTILWSDGSGAISDPGLTAGNYDVVVTDHNGCTSVQDFTVTAPTQIGLSLSNSQLPSCSNVCNGFLTAVPSGGTLPYTYNWLPNNTTQDTIGQLCAGTYTVNVTDANECKTAQISTLVNNPFLISGNPTIVDPACGQCNGSISLAPSGGTSPYTYTWTTSSNASSITNICPGPYQVNITDHSGCKQSIQIPVSSINSPTVTVASTNVNCYGLQNGSATASATGGILPYIFDWPSIPSSNATVNGLGANTYYVQVKDSAGCIATQTVTITQPAQFNANITTVPPTCGSCNGNISASVTGGSGSFNYSWSPSGSTTASVTNACAGLYTLIVGDAASSCKDTLLVGLNSSSGPVISVKQTDNTCFALCNGSATVTATGGTTPYTYTWSPSGGNAAIASNLCANLYGVQVEDGIGCIQTETLSVNEPAQLIAALPTLTSPKCAKNANGSIGTVISGGTPAYTYSWSPSSVSGANPQNLSAGVYNYIVTDANGCTVSQTTTLLNSPFTINANPAITQPACAQCNGIILLNPSGGTSPYSYNWNSSPIDTSNQQTNLCAGIYQVNITDHSGCKQTIQVAVSSLNSPSVTVSATNVSCYGLQNGSATASATGGVLPYVFSWPSVPSGNATVNGLAANTYYVQVKDSTGCIATQSVSITQPTQLNANATTVAPLCGACNGSINTTVTGGSGTYAYAWSPAGGTGTGITNACAGIYTLTITDNASGCKDTLLLPLNNNAGPSISIVANDETCFGMCNGSATVTASGGSPGYTYTWSPTGGNATTATNLCMNTYVIAVTDHAGCIQTQQFLINEPAKLVAGISTISPVKCTNNTNGSITTNISGGTPAYTYSWLSSNAATPATGANPQNLGAGIYSLTVTDANQCTNTVEIDTLLNPTVLHITGVPTPASCNVTPDGSITTISSGGTPLYSWQWSGASSATTQNLPAILPGTYSVTVTDSRNCTADTNFVVTSSITIIVNAGRDTALCTNAPIILTGTVTGTSTFDWQTITGTVLPPVNTLTISVNPSSTTQYVLFAQNASGSCKNQDTVNVSISPAAVANAGPDQSILGGQAIAIGGNPTNPSGGTIAWSPNLSLSDSTAANPSASPAGTTTYIVHVKNSYGCIAIDSMVLTVLPPFNIPTGFTPNGDGKNDAWMIDNISMFPNVEIEVYNRWGEQLFYSKGNYPGWNGYYNGKPVPVGTYYYIIRLNDKRYPDHFAGPLTILR